MESENYNPDLPLHKAIIDRYLCGDDPLAIGAFLAIDAAIVENVIESYEIGDPHPDDYPDDYDPYEEPDPYLNDTEADADVLRSAGWGTDEDYGYYGDEDYF